MVAVRCTDGKRFHSSAAHVPQVKVVRENDHGSMRFYIVFKVKTTAVLRVHKSFTDTLTLPKKRHLRPALVVPEHWKKGKYPHICIRG